MFWVPININIIIVAITRNNKKLLKGIYCVISLILIYMKRLRNDNRIKTDNTSPTSLKAYRRYKNYYDVFMSTPTNPIFNLMTFDQFKEYGQHRVLVYDVGLNDDKCVPFSHPPDRNAN